MPDATDRIYLEFRLSKSIQTDENGNFIIEAEASNENLDFDGQVVLQRALTGSKDYFLANGVISYDHRHLIADPNDPTWSPEKYIIGEPMGVFSRGTKTFVKAKLYKSNEIAQEIVRKLRDGSTRLKTSVGGRKPEVMQEWSRELGRNVEKVVRVLWDELAITFKPVNQTLDPVVLSGAAFVKSLSAGAGTDSSGMTGGRAMIGQDLEGAKSKHAHAVIMAMVLGDEEPENAARFLKNRGCTPQEADEILGNIVSNKEKRKKEVIHMDANLAKSFDDSIESLEKAMKGSAQAPKPKATPPANIDDQGYADMPPEEAIEGDEHEEDESAKKEAAEEAAAGMKKSLHEEMKESAGDFLDVTPFLDQLTKSISDRMDRIERKVSQSLALQKSIGSGVLSTGKLLKSLSEAPAPRQSVVSRQERQFMGSDNKPVSMSRSEILAKSSQLVADGKMDIHEAAKIEERLNKGLPISDEALRLIKSM